MSAIENLGDPAIRDGLSWYLAVAESERMEGSIWRTRLCRRCSAAVLQPG